MGRFNFDSGYDDDDDDMEKDGEKEELIDELFLKDQIIAVQQENNEILLLELDQKILENALAFCKTSWFWHFRTVNAKLRMLKKVYKHFKNLVEDNLKI